MNQPEIGAEPPAKKIKMRIGQGLVLIVACLFYGAQTSQGADLWEQLLVSGEYGLLAVNGQAEQEVAPDSCQVTLGLSLDGPSASRISEQAAAKTLALKQALLSQLALTETELKLTSSQISPQRDYQQPRRPVIGYRANYQLAVKVEDREQIDLCSEAHALASQQKWNQLGNIQYYLSNKARQELTSSLTASALTDAMQTARATLAAQGLEFVRIAHIQLSPQSQALVYPRPYAAASAKLAESASVPTGGLNTPGKQTVQQQVACKVLFR